MILFQKQRQTGQQCRCAVFMNGAVRWGGEGSSGNDAGRADHTDKQNHRIVVIYFKVSQPTR